MYPAVVTDNRQFLQYGYIKVRSPKFTQNMSFDLLSDRYSFPDVLTNTESVNGKEIDFDIKAYLLSPLGGGRNYGLFALPQVGTKGYVYFVNEKRTKAVWMGNIFEPVQDEEGDLAGVNIPSDKEPDGEDTDGSLNKESNLDGDEGTIIFRQKTTRVNDDAASIDMQQLNTENLVVLDRNRVSVKHYSLKEELETKKYQSIDINSETEGEEYIEAKLEDIDNETKSSFKMYNNKIETSLEGEEIRKITLDNEEGTITINSNDTVKIIIDKDNNVIVEGAESIQLLGDGDNIVKYSELKKIIDALNEHVHVAPNGPTKGPLTSSLAPLSSKINTPSTNMKSEKVQTE
jgi:hypothetical protein